jgi:hypothetical protein
LLLPTAAASRGNSGGGGSSGGGGGGVLESAVGSGVTGPQMLAMPAAGGGGGGAGRIGFVPGVAGRLGAALPGCARQPWRGSAALVGVVQCNPEQFFLG